MTNDQAQQASDLLYRTWSAGEVIAALPEGCRPASRADGYAIQARLEAHSARPLYGWKIAATSSAGQQHINVDGPIAGRILAERVYASGATLPAGANRMRVAEPEFAFRMGADLAPRATPYTVDEVMAAVASLHPSIEIPDSRYAEFVRVGGPQLIADNACGHLFVEGAATGTDWRALDLAAHRVVGTIGAAGAVATGPRLRREGVGANVLGDPRIALCWLANELSSLGIVLARGQTVTTGTCMAPLEFVPGERVVVDFGVLGTTTIDIV